MDKPTTLPSPCLTMLMMISTMEPSAKMTTSSPCLTLNSASPRSTINSSPHLQDLLDAKPELKDLLLDPKVLQTLACKTMQARLILLQERKRRLSNSTILLRLKSKSYLLLKMAHLLKDMLVITIKIITFRLKLFLKHENPNLLEIPSLSWPELLLLTLLKSTLLMVEAL